MKVFLLQNNHTCASQAPYGKLWVHRDKRDVTLWLSRTSDNSNFFIGSREVRDKERRL